MALKYKDNESRKQKVHHGDVCRSMCYRSFQPDHRKPPHVLPPYFHTPLTPAYPPPSPQARQTAHHP